MNNSVRRVLINTLTKLAARASCAAYSCLQLIERQVQASPKASWPGCKRIAVAIAFTGVTGHAIASDFGSPLVGSIVLGISGVLIVQALVGVTFVIQKKYAAKDPSHFIAIAVAFLLIGTITVLSEATYLGPGAVTVSLVLMYVPAAIAIFPPLLQRLKTARPGSKITAADGKRKAKRVAVTLSLLAFGFMSAVSLVVFVTDRPSSIVVFLLLLLSPFILAALAYLVGLWHRPEASD